MLVPAKQMLLPLPFSSLPQGGDAQEIHTKYSWLQLAASPSSTASHQVNPGIPVSATQHNSHSSKPSTAQWQSPAGNQAGESHFPSLCCLLRVSGPFGDGHQAANVCQTERAASPAQGDARAASRAGQRLPMSRARCRSRFAGTGIGRAGGSSTAALGDGNEAINRA